MRNIKIVFSYDGTDYFGWQTQPGRPTVQQTLENAIAKLTREERIHVNASGRTDSGVHAVGQTANFHSDTRIAADRLVPAINAHLPADIVVAAAEDVPDSFDAGRDAVSKLYRYVIHDGPVPSPFLRRYGCRSQHSLDVPAMVRASRVLLGKHDFRCFETEWPNRLSSVRTILHITINRVGEYIWLDVEADGFLYNMVRAIAGTLMNVGRGYWPETQVAEILEAQDRTLAGPTAPAAGLFLMRVNYGPACGR
jgi:tRNA pseudouridine38-40 synthase